MGELYLRGMGSKMSLYLPLDHPKRVRMEEELNKMLKKIHDRKKS